MKVAVVDIPAGDFKPYQLNLQVQTREEHAALRRICDQYITRGTYPGYVDIAKSIRDALPEPK